jgi:hypothetical protein
MILKYIFMIVLYAYPNTIFWFFFWIETNVKLCNYIIILYTVFCQIQKEYSYSHLASTSTLSIIIIYLGVSHRLVVKLITNLTKLYVFILYKLTTYIIKRVFCLFISCDTYEHASWWYNYTLFILKTITKSPLRNNG